MNRIIVATFAAVAASWIIFNQIPEYGVVIETLQEVTGWQQMDLVMNLAVPAGIAATIVTVASPGTSSKPQQTVVYTPAVQQPQVIREVQREAQPRTVEVVESPQVARPTQPRVVQTQPTTVQRVQQAGRTLEVRGRAVQNGARPIVDINRLITGNPNAKPIVDMNYLFTGRPSQ